MDNKTNKNANVGTITTSAGIPIGTKDATLTAGARGPILLQDTIFLDEIQHFVMERIPERVVCAKGAGAFGYFEVTKDITQFCAAKVFEKVGKRTPIACRFSTFTGESGSTDTVRDPRGFAVKFYTEDGIWDLVGSNFPVYFIRDPILFPSLVHSQKRNPQTHLKDADMFWDFVTLRPETTHLIALMYADRGLPDGYRHMHGYPVHSFKMLNIKGEPIYSKFMFSTEQGIKNLDAKLAKEMQASCPDQGIQDLYNNILDGEFPCWTVFIQVMTLDQAKKCEFNPFDATKIWPHAEFPLLEVGRITLDRNPTNYFAEIEQLAFNPANMIPGIEPSPDKMLQGRLLAYKLAQCYRLGANYMQIPVNCPYRVAVQNYQRDGCMTVTNNQAAAPNYYPNSFSGPETCSRSKALQSCCGVAGDINRFGSDQNQEDNYSQVTDFWCFTLTDKERERLVENIAKDLISAGQFLQERAIKQFTMVHVDFGRMLKSALDNLIESENKESGSIKE